MRKFIAIMMALVALVAFSSSAMAFESKLGARVLTDIGYLAQDEELTNSGSSKTDMFFKVQGWSYLRADFTSDDKTTGMRAEFGMGNSTDGSTSIGTRHIYGWYKSGAMEVRIGNTSPFFGNILVGAGSALVGDKGWGGLEGYGFTYTGRRPLVNFYYTAGQIQAGLGLSSNTYTDDVQAAAGDGVDAYFYWPRTDVFFKWANDSFGIAPAAFVVQTRWDGGEKNSDDTLLAWAVELPVSFTAGGFTAQAQIFYGVNGANEYVSFTDNTAVGIGGVIEDTTQLGGFIKLAFATGPWNFTGGVSYLKTENDTWEGFKNDSKDVYSAYIGAHYQVNDHIKIYPELAYFNNGETLDGENVGDEWMLGAQIRFTF